MFYLVHYYSDTYSNVVKCYSIDEVKRLNLSAPDGSNIFGIKVYDVLSDVTHEIFPK